MLGQPIPPGWCIPAAKLLSVLQGETSLQKEITGNVRAFGVTKKLLAVEVKGRLVRGDQPAPRTGLLPVARPAAFVVDAVADALGARLHGLGEGHVFHQHKELEDVAALVRGETVEVAVVRADMERGSPFIFEGAQALHGIDATRFELHILPHYLFDGGLLSNCFDVPLRNPALSHSHMLVQPQDCPDRRSFRRSYQPSFLPQKCYFPQTTHRGKGRR